jgi:ABC-type transport system involved in multi-copper enzyme maturation permease subunit
MNPRVLSHALRTGRFGLIWYLIATFFAVATGGLGLSTIQGTGAAAIQSIVKDLPPAMLDAFKINLSSFTSPVGYISARSLSLIWPLVVIAFAAGSAGAISGMIERGTIHFELSLPVSRSKWFSSRIVSGLVGLALIVLVTFVALSVFASAQWWRFVPLGLAFGVLWLGVAFAVAAFAQDRALVTGVVFGLFGLQYLLSIIADVVNGANWLGNLSIWGAYQPEQTVNVGVPWGTVTLWMLIGTACFVVALWRWHSRDIPA